MNDSGGAFPISRLVIALAIAVMAWATVQRAVMLSSVAAHSMDDRSTAQLAAEADSRAAVAELLESWDGQIADPRVLANEDGPNRQQWQQLAGRGVTRVSMMDFDVNAMVVMRPGADRKPGFAGIDDDANGVLDDRTELGASRSDDRCVVVPAAPLKRHEGLKGREEHTLVLQRGAFLPAAEVSTTGLGPTNAIGPRRAVIHGESDGRRWSMLVDRE